MLCDLKCRRNCTKIISNWVEMSLRIEYSERPSSHWIKPASGNWSWFPAGVHISHQKTYHSEMVSPGFPGGSVVKNLDCRYRGHGFGPRSRKIPHAAEQLSPLPTTAEPVPQLLRLCPRAQEPQPLRPACPTACALQTRDSTAGRKPGYCSGE